jgi:homoserine dehydrogenase
MKRKLRIGLFGFGCVGQGLSDILDRPESSLSIEKICVRNREKYRPLLNERLASSQEDILDDPDIDVIVELIDDHVAALDITRQALSRGKPVVSANKRMIAGNLDTLLDLQREQPHPFLYEAACCASIPIIRTLEHYYGPSEISGIEGIVNGTTNYILTRMVRNDLSFHDALKLAQSNGFAESDPSMDIEAFDAKFKLCLLATHAFGVVVPVDKVFNYGIGSISKKDIAWAHSSGCTVKLVARATRNGDQLSAAVLPQFVPPHHPLAGVENEYNGVLVHTPYSDAQFFHGRGAGGRPTASAAVADIAAAASRYRYGYDKVNALAKPDFTNDVFLRVYCRYGDTNIPRELPFDTVEQYFSDRQYNYITGRINLETLVSSEVVRNPDVFIAALPAA